jgi:lipid II:glycine glycyltransferase (peptidoglycan interpeptide bridge formation enzyme)
MVNFTLINDSEVWNSGIIKNKNFNPYQLFEWGVYKRNMGWRIASIKASGDSGVAYLQITYKIKFNIFLGLCVGSISGDVSFFTKEEFIEYLKSKFSIKYVFIKSSFTNILDFEESLLLYSVGWKKSEKKLNSDYTVYVDLTKSMDSLLASCSTNFRRNIKRGKGKNIDIKVQKLSEYNTSEIASLFDRFREIKDILLPDENEIKYIKSSLSNNIIIASSTIDTKIVGLRAFLCHGNKAIDFWATTDLVGRKNYTSFILLFELLQQAKIMGIEEYNMSGIDPLNNPNVYGFKNGLRAKNVEQLGTWDLSNSKIISFLINRVYL